MMNLRSVNERVPRILVVDDNVAIHEDARRILCGGGFRAEPDEEVDALEAELFGDLDLIGAPAPAVSVSSSEPEPKVDSAQQGQDAVEMVRAALREGRPYSVAFVDMRMPPGWDGLETTAKIWEVDPHVQIVICTAYSDYSREEIADALDPGDRLLLLKKPYDRVEFVQMTYAMDAKWAAQRELARRVEVLDLAVAERTAELMASMEERQRMELRLARAEKHRMLGHLAAGVAHECNSPLQFVVDNVHFTQTAVEMLLGMLEGRRDQLGPEEQRHLALASQEVMPALAQSLEGLDRVQRIVGALRQIAEASPGTLEAVTLPIERTLQSVVDSSPVPVRMEVPFGDHESAHVAEADLMGALGALLDNAGAAQRDGGRDGQPVDVTVSRRDGWVDIDVRDRGHGIPEEAWSRIFEPFFTTRRVGSGVGLGLTVARAAIERHGGTLELVESDGEGSRFRISLRTGG